MLYPRLARLRLDLATHKAGRKLKREAPLRILVDNSVLGLGVTHETKWISTGVTMWGDQSIDSGYAARVPVHSKGNKSNQFENIVYLTGIAHLARKGMLGLYLSAELHDEQFRHPNGRFYGYGMFDYSLFSGIEMESVDGWVFPHLGPSWMNLPSAAEQQRQRLATSGDQLFHALHARLREQLGPKCDQDAWHVRTAERHGMFCFLTMDHKLSLAVRRLGSKEPIKSLQTRIMSPAELGRHLGIRPVPPHLQSYDDASWIVRPDHVMPGEQRRRRRDYQR